MYKWSPYYRRYYRYRSPYNRYYRYTSPYYSRYSRYSPYFNRYCKYYSPYNKYRYSSYYPYHYIYYPYYSTYYNKYKWSPHLYRYLCDRYYNYISPYYNNKYYFDNLYVDLKTKMNMFKSFLDSVPKNRSEMVNDLEIPDDILKDRTYAYVEDELSSIGSEVSSVCTLNELGKDRDPLDTDSEISLSKALTDSEIDYNRYRRYKYRRFSNPFDEMTSIIEAFPEEYLVSLKNYQSNVELPTTADPPKCYRPLYNEDLTRKMRQFFDEECKVFDADDPGLLDLQEALDSIDLKSLDLDLI